MGSVEPIANQRLYHALPVSRRRLIFIDNLLDQWTPLQNQDPICFVLVAEMAQHQHVVVGKIEAELEISCGDIGLTDTLLGGGQYGQTLLVRIQNHIEFAFP